MKINKNLLLQNVALRQYVLIDESTDQEIVLDYNALILLEEACNYFIDQEIARITK